MTTAQAQVSLTDYITAVLEKLGLPVSNLNVAVFSALAISEGRGLAGWNPFDTTQAEPGATNFNSVGVKTYPTFQEGVDATATTLNNGLYDPLLTGLSEQQPFSYYVSGPGFQSLKTWQRGPHGKSSPPPAWVNALSSHSLQQLLAYASTLTTSNNPGAPAPSSSGAQLYGASSGSGNDPFGIGAALGSLAGAITRVAAVGIGFAIFVVGLFLIFGGDIERGVDKVGDLVEKAGPAAALA